ncbi:MAG: N-6 DNA methylase [Spirochaetaceae bacterium]|nr:N-6 DNA methylase [Spirochaetaceae bacterium]
MSAPIAEIARYLSEVDKLYRAGNATEHSYRPALKSLFEKITTGLTITNEPKHIACGAPDYIITKAGTPLGYIEAKDIPVRLDGKQNKEQFDRYKQSLGNLIITNYLVFQLFVDGELVVSVSLARENNGGIIPDKKQFPVFLELTDRFTTYSGKTITTSKQLAKMLADKAKLLAAVIRAALKEKADDDTLSGQYEGFKKILIHNLDRAEFADIYAQTLAYGLFAARLNQKDDSRFTRYLAAQLIPRSNPFLRKFFYSIAGVDLDSRIAWIVDALADLFNGVAIAEIQKEFERAAQDPYIHFYETFLAEYDPALRETRGVYYTPLPVVRFMVQAADDILKNEFHLHKGLADYSTIKRTIKDKDGKPETAELHKVQILDPAAGTGTFLAEVIDTIYGYFSMNKGAWPDYCEKHLIPRIHGFEILMASYAMAHFKLDMKLKETGYVFKDGSRLRVYLTNSLEEPEDKEQAPFPMIEWLTQEANEASRVKRDAPVMVVLGNPPYSGESANITAGNFLAAYKKEPGGVNKLKEKNAKWLNDDYVKFIRYGQNFIEKYGEGVLAYINNHSFLDNPTFRGMRWNLLNTYDKIYILDLHGNSKKKETAPDGSKDEIVFDIQAGVSVNIFIKTGEKKGGELAEVFHYDVYGVRESKYMFLLENTLATVKWATLPVEGPQYFFTEKDFGNKADYEKGFSVQELFPVNSVGICSKRDKIAYQENIDDLKKVLFDFRDLSEEEIKRKYAITQESRDQKVYLAKQNISKFGIDTKYFQQISYRPFDVKWTYHTNQVRGFLAYPVYNVMRHFIAGKNIGLLIGRQGQVVGAMPWNLIFITESITDLNMFYRGGCVTFPLYLYSSDNQNENERIPNLKKDIVTAISGKTGLSFTAEKDDAENTFAPIDILDYIYAVLYSNNYRAKYKEFLKIDFPRVPYPENAEQFQKLASIGSLLRGLHLMEEASPAMDLANFPAAGTNEIETVNYTHTYKAEKVYINKTQYFDNVPPEVWKYYIGGFQPAQKWLKDRKGRVLSFEDIEHYQKIIAVLKMTSELQAQIDEIIKWPV